MKLVIQFHVLILLIGRRSVCGMYRLLISSINKRQSPVDIKTYTTVCDMKKCQPSSVKLSYKSGDCTELILTSKTWKVITSKDCSSHLVASHLPDLYRLIQFHAHWGPTSDCGSEHTLDGKSYPAEIHFVFWNTIYKTYDNAITHSDGLAVVGVFLKEGKYNPDYAYITSLISDAINTKRPVPISTTLDITKMIPLGSDFLYYDGSLTTPPYTECVLWTLMLSPVEVSPNQLFQFRRICSENYRECQYLCGRKIYCSMKFK